MDALAYMLLHDPSHLKGKDDDATLVPFEGQDQVCGWVGTRAHDVPIPVLFKANFKVTQQSDYPCNDVNWPIMSPRMMETLRKIADFPHRLVTVRFIDRRARGPAHHLPDGRWRPDVVDDRFAAMQLTEHIDVVDWERSTFRRSRVDPGLCFFEKLVLVTPPEGLPPLFRLSSSEGMLLVSAEARRALEAAGIRGVTFDELPDRRTVDTSAAS
jgi:hypothetical protein